MIIYNFLAQEEPSPWLWGPYFLNPQFVTFLENLRQVVIILMMCHPALLAWFLSKPSYPCSINSVHTLRPLEVSEITFLLVKEKSLSKYF